jgi:hypothetical protein
VTSAADYTFKDFIRYLALKAGTKDEDVLTYLAFLTQYDIYNLFVKRVAVEYTYGGKPISRTQFYIWPDYIIRPEDSIDEKELEGEYKLPQPVMKRIDEIIRRHSKKRMWQLATYIRKKLNLEPREKCFDYISDYVHDYFRHEKFKVIRKEVK